VFSPLDALTRDQMIGEFLREPREMSILISSHELDEVERLASHVAFLDEGRLLFQGTLPEVREHAREVFSWPLAVLVTLIQIALEWAIYKFGFFGVSPVAREIMRLLTPAWYIGVIAQRRVASRLQVPLAD
jgi:energy-coupling factor transporter ATP-binding protein EcfA2